MKTLYDFLSKNPKFKQTLNLKNFYFKRKNVTYKHQRLMVFDYENLLVIGVLFDLNWKEFWIWVI